MRKVILFFTSAIVFAQSDSLKTQQLNEVSVATKSREQYLNIGSNVTYLSKEDLKKFNGQSLNDVLNAQAGITLLGNFTNFSEPKTFNVRGGNNKDVVILVDGIPLKDITNVNNSLIDIRNINLNQVESIEIIRGANAVLYGANASALIIDVRTKLNSKKTIQGNIGLQIASFETYQQNLNLNGNLNGFFYNVSGTNKKSAGFSSAKDELNQNFDKDGFENQNITSQLGYQTKDFVIGTEFSFNHLLFNYDYDAFSDGKNRGENTAKYFGINGKFNHKNGILSFNSRFTNALREIQSFNLTKYQTDYKYDSENLFVELREEFSFNKYLKTIAGIELNADAMNYFGQVYDASFNATYQQILRSSDSNITTLSPYVSFLANYENFGLQIGSRYTNHSKFGGNFVYQINPFYTFNLGKDRLKLGVSLASAFIPPSLYQLYGDNSFVKQNFNLTPEKNTTYEGNLNYDLNKILNFNASFFYRDETNPIQYIKDGYQNFDGETFAKGFELGLKYNFLKNYSLTANYAFVEREIDVIRMPKHRVNASISGKIWKGNELTFNYQFTSKREDSFNVENADFSLFDVILNQKLTEHFSCFGRINNILNTTYVDLIGFNTPNRNYAFGVDFRF